MDSGWQAPILLKISSHEMGTMPCAMEPHGECEKQTPIAELGTARPGLKSPCILDFGPGPNMSQPCWHRSPPWSSSCQLPSDLPASSPAYSLLCEKDASPVGASPSQQSGAAAIGKQAAVVPFPRLSFGRAARFECLPLVYALCGSSQAKTSATPTRRVIARI